MRQTEIAAANAGGRPSSDIARACREKTVPPFSINDPHPEQSFPPLPPPTLFIYYKYYRIFSFLFFFSEIIICYSSRGFPESGEALRATGMTSQVCKKYGLSMVGSRPAPPNAS